MIKIAVIGLGSRGKNYGTHFAKRNDAQIVAVCDKYKEKIDKVKNLWKVPDEMCFTDEKDFSLWARSQTVCLSQRRTGTITLTL